MWRYDAARSAAAPDGIATNLTLLWSRKLPPVRQAWPQEPLQRLNFDASYEPVVMGKLMFLASPNDGSVTAYDTDTGAETWRSYTEGPVRCAPACWQGKIYVGSDDGYLYCLDAQTGNVRWKFRGAPPDRPDRRQLGNGHLVSFWPVRGGAVIVDGTVYFGAGIWPIFGVFVHALEAETGKVKWTNGDLNYIVKARCEHTDLWETGISPQGYLGVSGDKLIVPCGRAMPAGLDRATGKLINYDRGWRKGDSRVAAHGDYVFVGKTGMMRLSDFYECGSRFPMAAAQQEYKLAKGCDAFAAFENGVAYGQEKGVFYAHDVTSVKTYERDCPIWDTKVKALTLEPTLIWQLQTTRTNQPGAAVIKVEQRLYGHRDKKLLSIEGIKSAPRIAWEQDIAGKCGSLIAADNKLFAVTAEGLICCYGKPSESAAAPKTWDGKPVTLENKTDGWDEEAKKIIEAAGVKAGYCLVLGLKEGRLVEELLKQTELLLIGVDADAKKIDALRRRFGAAGFLGSRVELFVGAPFEYLFPPYLADLIVSEDIPETEFIGKAKASSLFDILRPYGGALCLEMSPGTDRDFETWVKSATLANAALKQKGTLSFLVREGALPGSAPWTHVGADAANTFCSQDDLVKAPLGFLWYGDIPGHPAGSGYEVHGGRVYTFFRHSRGAFVFAYDAYTGRPLWQNSIPASARPSDMAAMADGIYLALSGGQCMVLDPETGKPLRTFTFSGTGAVFTKGIRVDDDVILVACTATNDNRNFDIAGDGFWDCTTLVSLDRRSGAELWRRTAKERFNVRALAMGGGLIFCVDSIPLTKAQKAVTQPADLKQVESMILALDARTGKEVWSKRLTYDCTRKWTGAEMSVGGAGSHVIRAGYADDWLAYARETRTVLTGRFLLGSGLEAKSGRMLWENKDIRGAAPLIVRGKTLVTSSGDIHDVLTGERTAHHAEFVHRSGCNYAVASAHLFLQRNSSAFYYDFGEGKPYQLRNIRSSCFNNLVAADGLLSVPSAPGCSCNFAIQTSFAMMRMPEVVGWSGAKPVTMTPSPALPEMESKIERFQEKSTEGKSIDQNKATK